VVHGSVQASFAQKHGWKLLPVASHTELPEVLRKGSAQAALVPMLSALPLHQSTSVQNLGLTTTVMTDPALTGDVCISIDPRQPELRDRINSGIEQIKRDGRFDRLNSQYLPFKLQ